MQAMEIRIVAIFDGDNNGRTEHEIRSALEQSLNEVINGGKLAEAAQAPLVTAMFSVNSPESMLSLEGHRRQVECAWRHFARAKALGTMSPTAVEEAYKDLALALNLQLGRDSVAYRLERADKAFSVKAPAYLTASMAAAEILGAARAQGDDEAHQWRVFSLTGEEIEPDEAWEVLDLVDLDATEEC